ncbi:hypothetical protein DQ238_02435 [Geodermatophilus sp. TF02-6]|nr:hypothetical protein DQ238_02435 [Geodermatophilus sp. TF02-6]
MATADTLPPTGALPTVPPIRWSLTRFLRQRVAARRRLPTTVARPALPCPRRFGNSYLWPDGTWTHCG